ncbi:MAG: glycosyltransferase, partial [Actinomycetota bacterium]|nr:glycosyltransferase [Actinomycetota bacterium]
MRLTGWIPDEELRGIYGKCIGTVNPSTYEGYGLAVSESLAAGLPTIASDIPPHREIGGDAVLYFEAGDEVELASLLESLAGDPVRRAELARAARRRHQ